MILDPIYIIVGSVAFGIGVVLGYVARQKVAQLSIETIEAKIKAKIDEAEHQAKEIILKSKEKAIEILGKERKKIKEIEEDLRKREILLQREKFYLEKEKEELPKKKRELNEKIEKARELKRRLVLLEKEKAKELQRIAQMGEEEAKRELLYKIENEIKDDIQKRISKLEREGQERLESKAKEILAFLIQKAVPSMISEHTTTEVPLPNDEIKGRIIGKEGRNIKAFEERAGVELIIDETPQVIFLSSFDPLRREIAKTALLNLIKNGRINPARIEREIENVEKKMPEILRKIGKEAAEKLKIYDLDERLHPLLGKLKFRTSFGQNVLSHSIEVAHFAQALAREIGANSQIAKKAGLLHDIGKAVDQEVEGSHLEIGSKILEKFNIEKEVIEAIKPHHGEYPYQSLEGIIVQTADAISSSRLGARKETEEFYLQRLENLEKIATSFKGVKKAWAVDAGREIRIFVDASDFDDFEARRLAREVADRIEEEMKFPGEIRVVVIRESRVIEYAR